MPRPFDRDRDYEHFCRIWKEIGWFVDADRGKQVVNHHLDACETIVEDIHGEMEVGASRTAGTMWHQEVPLPTVIVAGVFAGRVGRRQGHAMRLTAQVIADGVAEGAAVASLGIFDQGYYDRLGFGNGPYIRRMTIDPRSLRVPPLSRPPIRLGPEDYEIMHAARLARRPGHGRLDITHPGATGYDTHDNEGGFGLGFRDKKGDLSHCLWMTTGGKTEQGPYFVNWMAWNTRAEFLELLSVLHSLGDQIHGLRIMDPFGIQVQQLLDRPFHQISRARDGGFDVRNSSAAYQQHRICDLPRCVAAVDLPGDPLRFNLHLTDEIEPFLPEGAAWRGCGGDWCVELGSASGAERGRDENLPTLQTNVAAFTRMWLGVVPPLGLTITDEFNAPDELLSRLEGLIRLPSPMTDWDY